MSEDSIGVTLKKLRKQQKLTLKELANITGVSISFLSQVERGKSSVTLESLKKIADALHVNPGVFFGEDRSDQPNEISKPFYYKNLSNGIEDAVFTPILVTLQPGESEGNAFSHDGHEFLFVVKGTLTVEIEDRLHSIQEQETIFFDANKKHYWYNYTDSIVQFLLISSKTKTI
ncbi:helix-turn-helix domain-containing protein [Alkalihalobacillus sp. CinArs1]|uniref:helix-turn-helix domain-containing protein n=1 Tax=Alkalihalobacillus sp. CinArs1 TaxID=2995314 RepID=UPI0022DD8F69|nr:XRE family transcriptional regulator [Alkalihalobacillus sp. CinArs1]